MKNEINDVLNFFEEAYIQRDVKNIDKFMEVLFDKNENVIVVGTSGDELCIGYDEVKNIFLSDWEYWGDLRIKADEATIITLGNTAVIYTEGTIKYSFNSNSDTYTRYLGYISEYFNGVSLNSKKTDKVKLTEINWKLCHLLNQRNTLERDYLWDLRISFVLIKKQTRWIIRQMQFSLPVVGHLPDVRIDDSSKDAIVSFKKETEKLQEYSMNNCQTYNNEIIKFLQEFNMEYLDENSGVGIVASKYFTNYNPLIINTDKGVYSNQDEISELISSHRSFYHEISLDYENCLINSNEEVVWIVTHGIMKKVISENKAYENTISTIENLFTSNLDDKDKLFNIRRSIAGTFKENAKGEDYLWPFRFEAVIIKEVDNWVFKYLQFSYPFNWILEGKTDAATVFEKNI